MNEKTKDELRIQLAEAINQITTTRNSLLWVLDKLDEEE